MIVISAVHGEYSMPENDTAQWVRWPKLAAVAGVIALCLFGGAFLVKGSLRLFGWGLAGGLTFSAAAASVNAYRRRGRLDMSRAAVDAKARRVRAGTTAAIAIGVAAGSMLSLFDGYSAPVLGFAAGIFAFLALLLSPLFALTITARPPTSPLSRMTNMERAARRNYE